MKRSPELRLTAEELRQDYANGLLSSHSYLYYLIRALRKDGWKLHIPNISIFCEQWGFSDRTFYWAKAKLIKENLLNEKIHGSIDLWLDPKTTATSCEQTATSCSGSATPCEQTATSCSETPSQTLHSKDSSPSSPSSHLITPLSHLESERDSKSSAENMLHSLASLLPSIDPTATAEIPEQDKCSGAVFGEKHFPQNTAFTAVETVEIDPEFLSWVIARVKKFPSPPIFPKQAAIALIKRSGAELKAEFEEYVKQLETAVLARYAPLYTEEIERTTAPDSSANIDAHLARLQAKWNIQWYQDRWQQEIREELEQHPEWDIIITPDGPIIRETS